MSTISLSLARAARGARIVGGAALVGGGEERDRDGALGRIETSEGLADGPVSGFHRQADKDRYESDRRGDGRADRQPLARASSQAFHREPANAVGEHRRMITYMTA